MSKDKKKKKKEKVTYIDDGRTLYDMSSVGGGNRGLHVGKGSFKDQIKTYFAAVRRMFIPMLITIGAICLIFGIVYVIILIAEMQL